MTRVFLPEQILARPAAVEPTIQSTDRPEMATVPVMKYPLPPLVSVSPSSFTPKTLLARPDHFHMAMLDGNDGQQEVVEWTVAAGQHFELGLDAPRRLLPFFVKAAMVYFLYGTIWTGSGVDSPSRPSGCAHMGRLSMSRGEDSPCKCSHEAGKRRMSGSVLFFSPTWMSPWDTCFAEYTATVTSPAMWSVYGARNFLAMGRMNGDVW